MHDSKEGRGFIERHIEKGLEKNMQIKREEMHKTKEREC